MTKFVNKKRFLAILPELEYPHQVLISPQKWEYISTQSADVNKLADMA